jgi:hypothetical protein
MAHFAELNENNIVTQVIVADQSFVDSIGGTWVETFIDNPSHNRNAGIGHTYDPATDTFIAPPTTEGEPLV